MLIVRNSLRFRLSLICSLVILSRRKPIHKKFQINMKHSHLFGNCELFICSRSHHRGLRGNYCPRSIPCTVVGMMYNVVEMMHLCQSIIFKSAHLNWSLDAFLYWWITDQMTYNVLPSWTTRWHYNIELKEAARPEQHPAQTSNGTAIRGGKILNL